MHYFTILLFLLFISMSSTGCMFVILCILMCCTWWIITEMGWFSLLIVVPFYSFWGYTLFSYDGGESKRVMKNDIKNKDQILSQIQKNWRTSRIENFSKYLKSLEDDGYVETIKDDKGQIKTHLTRRGEIFIAKGGYNAEYEFKRNKKRLYNMGLILAFILGIAFSYVALLVLRRFFIVQFFDFIEFVAGEHIRIDFY